jgi:hypothetical protein
LNKNFEAIMSKLLLYCFGILCFIEVLEGNELLTNLSALLIQVAGCPSCVDALPDKNTDIVRRSLIVKDPEVDVHF